MGRTGLGPRTDSHSLGGVMECSQRMRQANLRLLPETPVDIPENALLVADVRRDVARAAVADWVPAVAPDVV